jgi:GDPmannose 4,6-dehydratase
MRRPVEPRTAMVTGATGQDGYFLVLRLLAEGWTVHAAVRDVDDAQALFKHHPQFHALRRDLRDPAPLCSLVGDLRPEELYNLAGESSVGVSFADPHATWESNANVVAQILDAIRLDSPGTRFYQASSGEMFGSTPGGSIVHDETSALNPQSPYAAAKAAAHLLCQSYRESYDLRIACGILFNHESRRRGPQFLSRKVIDHVSDLRAGSKRRALALGNLKAQRDWGFAPNYVDGMIAIIRQAEVRGVPDEAASYNDYVLGTGRVHNVWELVDRGFALAGFALEWDLGGSEPTEWSASFADSGDPAVIVDPAFLRPADPKAIGANPARVIADLGWRPVVGLDPFLEDMLAPSHGTSV